MKGDFSRWKYNPNDNFSGVLHQQGRVLLDRDWNDEERIDNHWQDQAAQDVIGPGVAAVPAGEPDSLQVQAAAVDAADRVELTVAPGRLWADGILTYLPGEPPDPTADIRRIATYLQPPIQDPPHDESGIGERTRDAVILEVWREALNGFQMPAALIEPALGGPDTTERILTAMRFRLFRLAPQDTCANIRDRLKDDFSLKGKLKVSLQPTSVIDGDCPVVEGGGYTGFEHHLYRIEIAAVNDNIPAMFKWSQFNGGLVGRGIFHAADNKVEITANLQAITTSGLNEFYLEALEFDSELGHWKVSYGAKATLNNNELELPDTPLFGSLPASGHPEFFRLWNDIREISDFLQAPAGSDPHELQDGIRLAFDLLANSNYIPGDYWTFPVRAGEIGNSEILIDNQPPEGIHYHRVPLAVLYWNTNRDIAFSEGEIEDCRDIVRPLTNQTVCCTFTVGDGRSSHGDFNSLEEAVRHLPESGGEICLLPGLHEANVIIKEKRNIKIKGCDKKTKIIPGEANRDAPIFHIIDSRCITLEHMDMATLGGTTITAEATELGALKEVEIHRNRMQACENGISITRGIGIHIHRNLITMLDKEGAGVAVNLMAEDSLIERNTIGVVSSESIPPVDTPGDADVTDPTDPCTDPERVYRSPGFLIAYLDRIWSILVTDFPTDPYQALGGIQIAAGSEKIKALENKILGGAGNGITLGSTAVDLAFQPREEVDETEHVIKHEVATLHGIVEDVTGPVPGINLEFARTDGTGTPLIVTTESDGVFLKEADPAEYRVSITTPCYRIKAIDSVKLSDVIVLHGIAVEKLEEDECTPDERAAALYEIQIDRNEITNMGLSGIGFPIVAPQRPVPGVAVLRQAVGLPGNPIETLGIRNNLISNCLQSPPNFLAGLAQKLGFGGISLSRCENVVIKANRIEGNGISHVDPVCGIFILLGEQVEISRNQISANGLIDPDAESPIIGLRGGIVLTAISNLEQISPDFSPDTGGPAAYIHDNVVQQPAGQALRLVAFGAVSVTNNFFAAEFSVGGIPLSSIGAVMIMNNGDGQKLPSGLTLINGNQVRLGARGESFATQFIGTADDLGFDGNQSMTLNEGMVISNASVHVNTLVAGKTLRASDNRFKETPGGRKLSLQSKSDLMNNTTNNQGDHCIFADNTDPDRAPVVSGNQVLDNTGCNTVRADTRVPVSRFSVMARV